MKDPVRKTVYVRLRLPKKAIAALRLVADVTADTINEVIVDSATRYADSILLEGIFDMRIPPRFILGLANHGKHEPIRISMPRSIRDHIQKAAFKHGDRVCDFVTRAALTRTIFEE